MALRARFGLEGAGVAFFASYVFHAVVVYALVGRMTGFRWSAANRRTGVVYIAAVGLVFSAFLILPSAWATTVGALVLIASGTHSARELLAVASRDSLPGALQRLLARVARMRAAP